MVLIDTSVWIAIYRRRASNAGRMLWQLAANNQACVCGQVWMEFIGGFRAQERRNRHASQLKAYRWIDTARQAYELAAEWCATRPGLGPGDAIIAATALCANTPLLTLDKGFDQLSQVGLHIIRPET